MRAPAVGQVLPDYERVGSLQAWNRFAAVNDEFIDMHMDDAAAAALGYPGAIGMGNLQTAYLHCLLRDWLGPDGGAITALRCQFRSFSLKGATVTARGVVTAVAPAADGADGVDVELEVWTESDSVRVATGTASVRLHPNT